MSCCGVGPVAGESTLNFSSFGVRLRRNQLHQIPELLRAIPPRRVAEMQSALARLWERFTYSSLAIAERDRHCAAAPRSSCSLCRRAMRVARAWAAEGRGKG